MGVRTLINTASRFMKCYTGRMAKTSAHTRTYASVKAMANLAVHNTRQWSEDHPAPRYLLPDVHHDSRGNVAIWRDLTPEMVVQEYLDTNRFGQKHGKLHHKAKPLRETVVVCEARHGREDMARLMGELERHLPFRCMYGYLHRDEGHIDKETGQPVYNYHMHIGHTNLIDGELVNPGKNGLRRMQDVCAEVLGMERGTPAEEQEEKRPHLTPREYRRVAREKERAVAAERAQMKDLENANRELTNNLATRNREYDGLNNTNRALLADNVRLKEDLDRVNAIREKEEQALKRLKKDPDLDLGPGLDTVEDLSNNLVETNRQLRKQIQESGRGTPAIYKRLKEIKTADLPIPERLQAMAEYVDELLQDTPAPEESSATAPAGPAMADEVLAWQVQEQADRQQAEEEREELQATKDLAERQAQQLRQLEASQETVRQQAEQERAERQAAEEKARRKTIEERDQEWRKKLKEDHQAAARDIDRMELPKTKTLESAVSYRERISDLFISWRAKLLNYVADLKQKLARAERKITEQEQNTKKLLDETLVYREAVAVMSQEQRDELDEGLDNVWEKARQEKGAQEQARRDKAQEHDRDDLVPDV